MVVVVTEDLALAEAISGLLDGERYLVLKRASRRPVLGDEGPEGHDGQRAMRAAIYAKQPQVLLLDVRFGGNEFRAIQSVPRIMQVCGPAVILLAPRRTPALVGEAGQLGCFDVISLSSRAWKKALVRCVAEGVDAFRRGLLDRHPRLPRRALH